MANNFKTDDSFLRKLAVGAAGTNATIKNLKEHNFLPIELERGSTGFKIWKKIKIKRIRIPDILCLRTGLRFESRGKTKLEISMSHSLTNENRRWDYGMREDDIVSVMLLQQSSDSYVDVQLASPIHFIKVKDMKSAYDLKQVELTKPKGFEEGSEVRAIWISKFANSDSRVVEITDERICLAPTSGRRKQYIQLKAKKGKFKLFPQVKLGDEVLRNQIVASVVPLTVNINCSTHVSEDYFIKRLDSKNLSERYAAAKALRYRGYTKAHDKLLELMNDPAECIYVQLEAAAALAVNDDTEAWNFISRKLRKSSEEVPLETQLETIIVLSEIQNDKSESLIIGVLKDENCDNELRAGAAWALGQFATSRSASALAETFNTTPTEIRIEAARALLRIASSQEKFLVKMFQNCETAQRDGLAWVLAKVGKFNPSEILNLKDDENMRQWLSYIVGYGKDNFSESMIKELSIQDKEVYFAASVLWQIVSSWIYDLKEY